MKKLILLILLIPSLLFAGPLQQAHKKVIAALTVAGGGDGFIGNNVSTSAVAFTTVDSTDQGMLCLFEADTSGTIGYMHVYMQTNAAGKDYNVAIYSADGNSKLAEGTTTEIGNIDTWQAFELDSTFEAEAGTSYILAIGQSDNTAFKIRFYDDDGIAYRRYVPMTISDPMPSTIAPDAGSAGVAGYTACIYADNTASNP